MKKEIKLKQEDFKDVDFRKIKNVNFVNVQGETVIVEVEINV